MEKLIWKENTSIGCLERTLYRKIINIEDIDMVIELYSPCSIEKELDITFYKKNVDELLNFNKIKNVDELLNFDKITNFDELVNFKKPILAFRKIINEIVNMLNSAMLDKDWYLTINVDCEKRKRIYNKLVKKYNYEMLGIGDDEYILVKM